MDAGAVFALLVVIGIVVAVVMVTNNNRAPFQLETTTRLSPDEAIRTAVQNYTLSGWMVTSQSANNATFLLQKKPSCLVAGLLFCLGLIPGILYLVFAGRTLNVNVFAQATQGSATTVQIQGTASGFGGRETADRVMQALGGPSTAIAPQIASAD